MNGSSVAQWLWQSYNEQANATAVQQVNTILPYVAGLMQSIVAIAIIIFGKNLMFGEAGAGEAVARMVRGIIVVSLLTPTYYNQFITTAMTQTIPNQIATAISGAPGGMAGAQAFDGLINAVTNFGAQVRAQAVGPLYIGERITIWFAQASAMGVVGCCLLIWSLAQAAISFIVPLGAFVIPFYLFRATQEWAMRWIGKVVSLFLVLAVSLMLGAFVVNTDARYMQEFGKTIGANAPARTFSMNAGDLAFSGFSEAGAILGNVGGIEQAAQANSANVDASISAMWRIVLVFLFGLFLMAIMVGIALFIGGSHGFSAAPAITAITVLGMRGGNFIAGKVTGAPRRGAPRRGAVAS